MSFHEQHIHTPPMVDKDFTFALGTSVSEIDWLDLSKHDSQVLAQREEVLRQFPDESLLHIPDADPLILEARSLFGLAPMEGKLGLEDLAMRVEHDLVLLKRGEGDSEPYMVAGAVCFPSAWSPEEKLGKPISEIHSPVPTLNAEFGVRIARFLNTLRSDKPYKRWGWGLAATSILNLHPTHNYPRLSEVKNLEDIWIRFELQGFHALPSSEGLLFSIYPVLKPLHEVISDSTHRAAFRRQIETMSDDIAEYKGVHHVREFLLSIL